jgi:hypothetical protein
MVKKPDDHRIVEFSLIVKRILGHRGGLNSGSLAKIVSPSALPAWH